MEAVSGDGSLKNNSFKLETATEKMQLGAVLHAIKAELVVGKKVLIGCAWCREDEVRLFKMFPEVLMVDVTMGTNNQRMPQLVSCSPGPDMKIFTPVRAFLPSQCQWVFMWVFGVVFPTLLGTEACNCIQLVLTDGDHKEYDSFEAHKKEFYRNAVHGLCIFHLVTQPISRLGSKILSREDQLVKDQLVSW
jgi:hypothetical protein